MDKESLLLLDGIWSEKVIPIVSHTFLDSSLAQQLYCSLWFINFAIDHFPRILTSIPA